MKYFMDFQDLMIDSILEDEIDETLQYALSIINQFETYEE